MTACGGQFSCPLGVRGGKTGVIQNNTYLEQQEE